MPPVKPQDSQSLYGKTLSLRIPAALDQQRADKALGRIIEGLSRTLLRKILQGGGVVDARTDQPIRKGAQKLYADQKILIHIPVPKPLDLEAEEAPLDLLHEDEHLLVLNKPAGLTVHPAAGFEHGTLVNILLHHCRGRLGTIGGAQRPGIVHRLDRLTSGLMVVAKTDRAMESLGRQFKEHTVGRAYRALVWGRPTPACGFIDRPIGRSRQQYRKMAVTPRGRAAYTAYQTVEAAATAADLLLRLRTGRTHQIRVHLAALGYPVIGDPLYGKPVLPKASRQGGELSVVVHFGRQALHAYFLSFEHPQSGKRLAFTNAPPQDWLDLRAALDFKTSPLFEPPPDPPAP